MITLIGVGMFHISQLIAVILAALATGVIATIALLLLSFIVPPAIELGVHWLVSGVKAVFR